MIQLTHFWLKGNAIKETLDGPFSEPLSRAKMILLKHDQNEFSFGFTAIDYGNPGEKVFYCKLENYDIDWRLSGAEEKVYYFNVPPGKYIFRVKVLNSTNGASSEKDIAVIISRPWWTSWWAYSMYFIMLVAVIYLFNRLQRKQLIRKEQERGKLRELEMQTLRAQMNPHFIFNCLSSINHFVLKNETEAASDYLTKFSKLVRNVLANSKKPYISLDEEMETLRLYLDMEKLRFKDRFDFCIRIESIADSSAIYIPPLLFQPFVENAIWHGLMHKSDPGKLDVRLTIEKDLLICVIQDNGVGRAFAQASESKSAEKQKSMGIQITRHRMSLINGAQFMENDFEIEDLYDDTGHATGTRVMLRIKYKEMADEAV
jgi:hypothetical protein